MTYRADHEDLMRYLDGELPEEERNRVEVALEESTELQRELAIFKAMKEGFGDLSYSIRHPSGVWDHVSRKLARPVGWLFLIAGAALWLLYGAYVFVVSPGNLVEKLATGAVVIGVILLLVSVVWEQYKAWHSEPYRDVQR